MDSISKTWTRLVKQDSIFIAVRSPARVKIFYYSITYIVYVIPVIMKNIWPVKTARYSLYFIACQNVFHFVLRKSIYEARKLSAFDL